jgi:hypothetical protein
MYQFTPSIPITEGRHQTIRERSEELLSCKLRKIISNQSLNQNAKIALKMWSYRKVTCMAKQFRKAKGLVQKNTNEG